MEGFKTLPKGVKCFKEGGSVYKSRHSEKREMSEDVAQDKKIVKKAFTMHDAQEHKGEHTDLSKLKKGGRAKKAVGTVKKYKTGGKVENQYAAKKTDKDIKDIANTKRQKPALLCGGKSVKKYSGEDGSYVESEKPGMGARISKSAQDMATKLKENTIGTPEQNRIGQEYMDKRAAEGSGLAKFLGGKPDRFKNMPYNRNEPKKFENLPYDINTPKTFKELKKGGKVKK
jgi:hypothetical protein